VVELHGGTIQAQSQGIGQGATFTVKLPILEESRGAALRLISATLNDQRSVSEEQGSRETGENNLHFSPQPPVPSTQCPIPNPLTNLRVLVVDDEADVRQWITAILEESGAKVSTFSSTRQALEALKELHPDVLISDIGMPDEDGYALMRKIREIEVERGGRIPAVALTGYARVEDYKEALAAGFQLHVAKPVRAAELIAVVASLGKMSGKI
jgi:CheY-like chemotaxis protein